LDREPILHRAIETLRGLDTADLKKTSNYLNHEILKNKTQDQTDEIEGFVGSCPAIKEVFSLIRKVAPTDLPVLIMGESGTGKELTARAIHDRSLRADKLFVPINCAAIPGTLMEAELFGYAKGRSPEPIRLKRASLSSPIKEPSFSMR
jgi:transcriptional regulator with PAS, ATPase and Fis domain